MGSWARSWRDSVLTKPIPMARRESSASACATPTDLPRARSGSIPPWPGPSGSSSYRARGGNTRPVGEFAQARSTGSPARCMLVNPAMIAALGGMDEDFFLYYEEVAFSRAARRLGWRVEYDASVTRGPPTSLAKSGDFAQDAGHHPAQQAALFPQALAALAVSESLRDRGDRGGDSGNLVQAPGTDGRSPRVANDWRGRSPAADRRGAARSRRAGSGRAGRDPGRTTSEDSSCRQPAISRPGTERRTRTGPTDKDTSRTAGEAPRSSNPERKARVIFGRVGLSFGTRSIEPGGLIDRREYKPARARRLFRR